MQKQYEGGGKSSLSQFFLNFHHFSSLYCEKSVLMFFFHNYHLVGFFIEEKDLYRDEFP